MNTIEYQRHPNFPPVTAEKEGKWPDRQSQTRQKTTPGYPDAENVIVISADKGYKTRRKPNQSPTVMNNIISKSSMCPYILEGRIVDLWNCYIGQKLTEKEDLAVFAWRDGSFQTIPTSHQGGWQFFLLYLGKRYEPYNSLRLNPTENIMHSIHKSSIKRELSSTAVNSQINRPGVTLHFFRFLGDFEKGFAKLNALLCYLLSWTCCWMKTKCKLALPFLQDVKIKCSDNSGTPYMYIWSVPSRRHLRIGDIGANYTE